MYPAVLVSDWLPPTVVSSLIAAAVGLATHFSSQRTQKASSREDIRTEAFDQAKAFYVDLIDRQNTEIEQLRAQCKEAIERATEAETTAATCRSVIRALQKKVEDRNLQLDALEMLNDGDDIGGAPKKK